ncbi:hypothetical protein JXI42_05920 [bacterium]|nr:hypothetical protein [bacterium]
MALDVKSRKIIIGVCLIVGFIIFFYFAATAEPDAFHQLGFRLPLSVFTIIIALIDGFNPCTLWVLTFLLTLLLSVSHQRARVFAVGYSFVAVVYVIYFLFMAAWLNIYLFVGYVDTVRIIIAIIAIIAGLINCKDFFFFKKGVSLMIPGKFQKSLIHKMDMMRGIIQKGSLFAVIAASIVLAAFASLVELPCTAGWPVIYTKILAEKGFENNLGYYLYLIYYNLVYIVPLATVITVFGYMFKGKAIKEEHVRVLKLIGGLIMLALGVILIVNPDLLTIVH